MMKGLRLKTSIGKDRTLNFPMWNSGTKETMLMHVIATLDAIKKRGHFKAYKKIYLRLMEPAKVWKNPRRPRRRPRKLRA